MIINKQINMKMLNFDNYVGGNKTEHNKNWPINS